ncbi:hypothetical protein [Fulvivirga ligni]|uniref:hypothetical protein n=1 Tax=Fulvivirga ligni TaxID=2904246 RepID=UPI001F2C1268|nr:hypothetical protein [Fulvivirga ligni]UII22648.1 hypothetical protein LVD16_05335 [Fulvivirga ligni]
MSKLCLAQKYDVKLSPSHLKKIERAKDARSKLDRYRKFYTKDSTSAAKKEGRYWRQKSDSLSKVYTQERLESNKTLSKIYYTDLDSVKYDSLVKVAEEQGKRQTLEFMQNQGMDDQWLSLNSGDSLSDKIANMAENELLSKGGGYRRD